MKSRTWILWAFVLLVGCASAEDAARTLYEEASASRDIGQLEESERLLEDLLARFPATNMASEAAALLGTVRSSSETAALEAVSEIREAQEGFMRRERRYAQSVQELVDGLMLAEAPDDEAIGYTIRSRSSPAADGYTISAEATGDSRRSFFQDLDGVMRWAVGDPATPESLPLE